MPPSPSSDAIAPAPFPRGRVRLLAAAAGLTVADLYYAQPLAADIARSLHSDATRIGTTLFATQVGYALGMVLLVPLSDGRERRALLSSTAFASVPCLLFVAAARSVPALLVASFFLGLTSSVPQLIVPYAVDLGSVESRGRIVGAVMSGILTGILLSRTASGALARWVGWRGVFVGAAVVTLATAIVLRTAIPRQEPKRRIPYRDILRSLIEIGLSEPIVRRRAAVGALGMASFSAFWAMLSFHLASLGYGSEVAGAFGALGVAGVLVAPIAGRLAVRGHAARLNLVLLLSAAASFAVMAIGRRSLWALGVGVVLMDAGIQGSHLTNQAVIFGLRPELRGRINAIYMVSYFVGAGLGTGASALAWATAGWSGVCALGASFAILGLVPIREELRE